MTAPTANAVRILIALDVPEDQAADVPDLLASVRARLLDEAGYLDNGQPVTPINVVVALVEDGADWPEGERLTELTSPEALAGIYNVGVEGVE